MTHSITLANTEAAANLAKDWITAQCACIGVSEAACYQITTCLVEAVNNAIVHKLPGDCGQIRIKLYTSARCLVLQIRDSGPCAESGLSATVPESDAIGGRGWFIINQWMDVVRFKRFKVYNIVTLARHLELELG
jgi:serine/threonine-protein kinase RsbW